MRKIIIFLFLALVVGNASSQIKKEVRSTKTSAKKKVNNTKTVVYKNKDAVAFGLKGKVKTVKVEAGRVGSQNLYLDNQLLFNIYGDLIDFDYVRVENKIYDKQNRLIEMVVSKDRYKFEYDEKGRIKKYTECIEASLVKGKPIRYNVYEYIYDKNNIITSSNYHTYASDAATPENFVYNYCNYKYDKNGNWIYREKDNTQYVRTITYF